MNINITFVRTTHYDIKNIKYWFWYFKKYANVRGFIIRIFGIHFNIKEKNGTQKLINIFKSRMPS